MLLLSIANFQSNNKGNVLKDIDKKIVRRVGVSIFFLWILFSVMDFL